MFQSKAASLFGMPDSPHSNWADKTVDAASTVFGPLGSAALTPSGHRVDAMVDSAGRGGIGAGAGALVGSGIGALIGGIGGAIGGGDASSAGVGALVGGGLGAGVGYLGGNLAGYYASRRQMRDRLGDYAAFGGAPKTASDQGRDAALEQLGLKIANDEDGPMSPGMHALVGAGLGGALGAGSTYYHLGQGDNLKQLNARMLLRSARSMRNQPGFNFNETRIPGAIRTTFSGTPEQMKSLNALHNTSRGFHSGVSGLLGAGAGALGGYLVGKMREE